MARNGLINFESYQHELISLVALRKLSAPQLSAGPLGSHLKKHIGGISMNGNICPKCGNPVMPYSRFIREAEPYKVSACGGCGVKLRRSPKVYIYLLIVLIIVAAMTIGLFMGMVKTRMAHWIMWMFALLWLCSWVVLINYLSWRYIGWVIEEPETKK
jgi:uncharacterized protein (DUF983 family)